jgi:hypothetical protein
MIPLGVPLSPWLGSLSASVQRAVPARILHRGLRLDDAAAGELNSILAVRETCR